MCHKITKIDTKSVITIYRCYFKSNYVVVIINYASLNLIAPPKIMVRLDFDNVIWILFAIIMQICSISSFRFRVFDFEFLISISWKHVQFIKKIWKIPGYQYRGTDMSTFWEPYFNRSVTPIKTFINKLK